MAANDYHFITHWRVKGNIQEVFDILYDAGSLAQWWPSVYLEVTERQPGNEEGIGAIYDLHTKGWLPYHLHWQLRVSQVNAPHDFTIQATGDFDGRGIWTLEQNEEWVDITFDWKLRADMPLLRYLSAVLKPVFSANHRWAMEKGEESLLLEMARRSARTEEERARLAPAPGPSTTSTPLLLLGCVGLLGAGLALVRKKRSKQ